VILRRALRDLRALGLRAVIVVIAIALAAGMGAGGLQARDNVRHVRDGFYTDNHFADVQVTLSELRSPDALLARARAVGATRASVRLIVPAEIKTTKGPLPALLVGMPADAQLNTLKLEHGRGLRELDSGSAVLEADFAQAHGVALGDYVPMTASGHSFLLQVQGLGRTPDSLLATADPEFFVVRRGSLAIVYLPLSVVQSVARAISSGPVGVNDLLLNVPATHGTGRLQALTRGLPVNTVTPRHKQFGFRATEINLAILGSFTPVLTVVLSCVAALLIAVTIMRLVQSQRRELGALLALGHGRRTVILSGIAPAIIIGLIGGILAIPACTGVAMLIAGQAAGSLGFPSVPARLTLGPGVVAVALALGTSVIAAIFPAVRLARLAPAEALRGEIPGSSALPAWARATTAAAGAASSYGSRALIRAPIRTALTVAGLAGAIGLGIALIIVNNSVGAASDSWFERQGWTHHVVLRSSMPEEAATRLGQRAGMQQVEPLVHGSAELRSASGITNSVAILGMPRVSRLETVAIPPTGIQPQTTYVSRQIMRESGLRPGERLRLSGPNGMIKVRIAGTADTLAEQNCYLTIGDAQKLLGRPGTANGLLVAGSDDAASKLRTFADVAKVVPKAEVKAAINNILAQLTDLLTAVVAVGLIVGALFLVSSLTMSVLERRGEFATLRALGWDLRDVFVIVVTESITLTTLGAVVGSLAAPGIATPLMRRIATAWFHIDYDLRLTSYLVVIVPALLLSVGVAVYTARRIIVLNIAEEVRARPTG